jgi:hypothetical protein
MARTPVLPEAMPVGALSARRRLQPSASRDLKITQPPEGREFPQEQQEIRTRSGAHGSISIQEGQPNPSFRRFGFIARPNVRSGSHGFRKHVKRLTEGGDDFTILPSAVR